MERAKPIITISGVVILLFWSVAASGRFSSGKEGTVAVQNQTKSTQTTQKSAQTTSKSTQTTTKSSQTKSKSATSTKATPPSSTSAQKSSKSEPDKKSSTAGTIRIGNQTWATANLNVITFRNGDSIPEAKTFQEWAAAGGAGKPAWCYYNNDPANGQKFGKLYNWFAVNDPRGLAPSGWTIPTEADWVELASSLGGHEVAGTKMKSASGWNEGFNGTNDAGFTGFPGGYRTENGSFINIGNIGTWWSATESKGQNAVDFYLSQKPSVGKSNTPRLRGESVRCIRK